MSSTIGSLLRVTQAHSQQICEKQTLDNGICYYAPQFPTFALANQFREVVLDDDMPLDTIYQQAQSWFDAQQLVCQRWAPAMEQETDKLATFLVDKGFSPQTYSAMQLTQWGELGVAENVRIIPARALRMIFRELVLNEMEDEPTDDAATRVQAEESRMDDPAYDAFVAMIDNRAVGRCSLYQVGDIACIMDFHVSHNQESPAGETALLAHVLALAKRLALRNICTQVESGNCKLDLLHRAGFEAQGEFVEFYRKSKS